jgi:predicted negative regulator of RcsB-dependent stress response
MKIHSDSEVFVSGHLTRKELKQDNIALRVEETFNFFTAHRKQSVRIGGAAVALVLIVAAIVYYRNSQQNLREQTLGDAIAAQNAPVGAAPPNGGQSFPTEAARKDAVIKAYTKIVAEHGGSAEAYVAEYALAQIDLEAGKFDAARAKYQDVADHANTNYASLGKLALAQLDFAQNRPAEAQKLLKDLADHPTDLVSKNQANFALAKGLTATQPEEARKLLLPLASAGTDVSQAAATALGDIQQK